MSGPVISSNPYRAGEPPRACAACGDDSGAIVIRGCARPLCEVCAGVADVSRVRDAGRAAERVSWLWGLALGAVAGLLLGLSVHTVLP